MLLFTCLVLFGLVAIALYIVITEVRDNKDKKTRGGCESVNIYLTLWKEDFPLMG